MTSDTRPRAAESLVVSSISISSISCLLPRAQSERCLSTPSRLEEKIVKPQSLISHSKARGARVGRRPLTAERSATHPRPARFSRASSSRTIITSSNREIISPPAPGPSQKYGWSTPILLLFPEMKTGQDGTRKARRRTPRTRRRAQSCCSQAHWAHPASLATTRRLFFCFR